MPHTSANYVDLFTGLSRFAALEQPLDRPILGKFIQRTSESNPDRRKMVVIRLVAVLATAPPCPPTRRGFLLPVSAQRSSGQSFASIMARHSKANGRSHDGCGKSSSLNDGRNPANLSGAW